MRGLWMWTITLFSFALFLRGEEPLRLKLRHLKLPSNYSGSTQPFLNFCMYIVHIFNLNIIMAWHPQSISKKLLIVVVVVGCACSFLCCSRDNPWSRTFVLLKETLTWTFFLVVNCGNVPQRIEVKIPWSKADRKAKGDLLLKYQFQLKLICKAMLWLHFPHNTTAVICV